MRQLEYKQFSRVKYDAGTPVIPDGDPSLEYYKIQWYSFEYCFDGVYIEGSLDEAKQYVAQYALAQWRQWLPYTKWQKHPWNEMWHMQYSNSGDNMSDDGSHHITVYINKCKSDAG